MTKNSMDNSSANLIDDLFDQEWYDNVMKATELALDNSDKINMDPDDLISYIVDYNIQKRLHEKILNSLVDTLPTKINWKNTDILDAFNEFKDIIDSCDICPSFKKYKAKIFIKNSSKLKKELFMWEELVNENYPNLKVTVKPLKMKNQYSLTVNNIRQ